MRLLHKLLGEELIKVLKSMQQYILSVVNFFTANF